MTTSKPYHHGDLRRQLIAVGEEVLAERGLAGLSLREVARRVGVSHNAPFKHFASREALLAAMAEAGFEDLGQRLAAADDQPNQAYIVARGMAYVSFALDRPTLFRLMFSGEIDMDRFPELAQRAEWSLGAVGGRIADAFGSDAVEDATLSAWAFVHGLAHLLLDGQIPPEMRGGRTDQELAKAVVAAMAHGLGFPQPS
jgi:AcrR family transcriptional regulator